MKISKVNQQSLFNYSTKDSLSEFQTPLAITSGWYKTGFLSFDPIDKPELDEFKYQELRFVASLFKSGLSLRSVEILLEKLEKPYVYNISSIYYNFIKAEWDYLPITEEPDEIEIEDQIDILIENEEVEVLEEIKDKIETFLCK
jgi:hypothetical protein